ncbi:MAG: hypothetical protein KBT21_01505 [Treponema sp.]|nr:hypothetical protein [Candidatus Treponema merdequi]
MKKNYRFSSLILGIALSLSVITGLVSCEQPSVAKSVQLQFPPAPQNEFLKAFLGTWENNDYNFHSEYEISKTYIKDSGMNVWYEIKSEETVQSADGCTLVFCEVAEGHDTQWTPAKNFYSVALKLEDGKLSISCPIDSNSIYKSLDELKAKYQTSYNVKGNNNYFTVCTKMEK